MRAKPILLGALVAGVFLPSFAVADDFYLYHDRFGTDVPRRGVPEHHDWHDGLHHDEHEGPHYGSNEGWHSGRHHGWHQGQHHDSHSADQHRRWQLPRQGTWGRAAGPPPGRYW